LATNCLGAPNGLESRLPRLKLETVQHVTAAAPTVKVGIFEVHVEHGVEVLDDLDPLVEAWVEQHLEDLRGAHVVFARAEGAPPAMVGGSGRVSGENGFRNLEPKK